MSATYKYRGVSHEDLETRGIQTRKVSVWIELGTVALIALGIGLAASLVVDQSALEYVLPLTAAPALVFALFRLPAHLLPSLALLVYASGMVYVLPRGLPIGIPSVIMVAWSIRRMAAGVNHRQVAKESDGTLPVPPSGSLIVPLLAVLLLCWIVILIPLGSLGSFSAGWVTSFAPVVILPLLFRNLVLEAEVIKGVWITLGGALGLYSVLEFALQENVLYWSLGATSSQHWSVYRAEGPFAHPLLFGTFLAVAAILAFGSWLEGRRTLLFFAACSALTGVLLTASRGSLAAVLIGIIGVIGFITLHPGRTRRGRALGLVVVIGAAGISVITATPLLQRWSSQEAGGSTEARNQGFELAVYLASQSGFLGTGGGTSSLAAAMAGSTLPIELSPLQALVSLGVIGALLLGLIVALAFFRAIVQLRPASAIALLTFVIAISGYNYLDDRRSALILLGSLLIVALGERAGSRHLRHPKADK